MARILAELNDYPPTALIGSFRSTHHYLAALAAAGHRVDVVIAPNVKPYTLDGVNVRHVGALLYPKFQKCDLGISHVDQQATLHKLCVIDGKPSVRFLHGVHEGKKHQIDKWGKPDLVVFNSRSMAAENAIDCPWIVCYPSLDFDKFRTTPGDHITLINTIPSKGSWTFDQIARWMPDRQFLGVRGGYGIQTEFHRPNITHVGRTSNMRDDVYARTRILLMPSQHESWGLVAIEAAVSGIPTIAAPTPGLQEALGTAGIFVDPEDIAEWVEQIGLLNSRRYYKHRSNVAKERATELARDDSRDRFVKAVEALL